MGCNKRIRKSIRRKMSTGGNIVNYLPQMAQYGNMTGSAAADTIMDVTGTSATADENGLVDPNAVFFQTGMSNITSGPLGFLTAMNAQQQARENNKEVLRQAEYDSAWDQLGRSGGILPGQSTYNKLMPYGGRVASETVELERGEPFKLPNGNINSISTSAPTHKQGGVPITLPNGTKVLGKKKSMKGKQFKEMGRKLEGLQKKYLDELEQNPTSLRARTSERMLNNINMEYEKLFKEQGVDVGRSKMPNGGVITMSGSELPKYPYGKPQRDAAGDVNYYSSIPYQIKSKSGNFYYPLLPTDAVKNLVKTEPNNYFEVDGGYGTNISYNRNNPLYKSSYKKASRTDYLDSDKTDLLTYGEGGTIHIKPENRGKFNALKKRTGKTTEELTHSKNPLTRKRAIFAQNAAKWRKGEDGVLVGVDENIPANTDQAFWQNPISGQIFGIDEYATYPSDSYLPLVDSYNLPINKPTVVVPPISRNVNKSAPFVAPSNTLPASTMISKPGSISYVPPVETLPFSNPYPTVGTSSTGDNTDIDYTDTLNTIGSLAPMAYNIYQGLKKPEKVSVNKFNNPYEGMARSLMNRRKYDISPELERNELSRATLNRMMGERGLSKGQILGGLQASNVALSRANAEALSRAQNMNAQYMGDQAQMEYNLGRDVSARRAMVYDINKRNEAAQRNYMSTGLSQLSQYSQIQQLQKNQMLRDEQKLGLLESLAPGFYLDPKTYKIVYAPTGKEYTPDEYSKIING